MESICADSITHPTEWIAPDSNLTVPLSRPFIQDWHFWHSLGPPTLFRAPLIQRQAPASLCHQVPGLEPAGPGDSPQWLLLVIVCRFTLGLLWSRLFNHLDDLYLRRLGLTMRDDIFPSRHPHSDPPRSMSLRES